MSDGQLEIDDNRAERALRAVAVGRKNGVFFMTEGGGETAAVLPSRVTTAKAIGIAPKVYLRGLLMRVSTESDAAKLTPHGWREHFAEDVAERHHAAATCLAGG